jgi:cell division protein YceG involved in septum cleavage
MNQLARMYSKIKRMSSSSGRGGYLRTWLITLVVLFLIVVGGVVGLRTWYFKSLKPLSSSTTTSYFTVGSGQSVHKISINLSNAHLVRSAKAFETYVRSNRLNDKIQAGTYSLSPSMSVQLIVKKMVNGEITRNLLTILPGKRLDEVKQAFKKIGYSQAEIDSAFDTIN